MSIQLDHVSGSRCLETIRALEGIGIRLSGTGGEKAAADWIERRFRQLGLGNIRQQDFPCLTFGHRVCKLSASIGGRAKSLKCEPAAHSPATKGPLQAGLVVLEKIPGSDEEARKLLAGRAVLVYCSLLFDWSHFKRIMGAGPAALLTVDDRIPGDWTVAVGFPRFWVDHLTCPVVNIPYMTAWYLVRDGVSRIALELDAFVQAATSQNVMAEIGGKSKEVIVLSGHHDSVANNPGADDNLTGVAVILELARVFRDSRPLRTLRFISYGTEEQLSEGARHYATHVEDADRIQLAINTDAVGGWMGTTQIFCTGTRSLRSLVEKVNRATGFPGRVLPELSPFSDHFPLNLRGVPSVWYYRPTFTAARHFHHSALETLDVISPDVMERTVRNQAVLLDRVANGKPLPFRREISKTQLAKLKTMCRDWFGVESL